MSARVSKEISWKQTKSSLKIWNLCPPLVLSAHERVRRTEIELTAVYHVKCVQLRRSVCWTCFGIYTVLRV